MMARTLIAIETALVLMLAMRAVDAQECVGDCDGDGTVEINELILGVNINLDLQPIDACPAFDCEDTGTAPVSCLIRGVSTSLNGCGGNCPIEAGTYTLTQIAGGVLRVGTLPQTSFPPGGTLVLDVKPASQPDCFHDLVVPFPNGFTSPAFCIPGTGYTARLMQTACGVGRIASSGNGDFTISQLGDSSSEAECHNQQECVIGIDDKARVDVTVGDGSTDECAGGQANVMFSVPVVTLTWIDETMPRTCPSADGEYNPETDQLLARVPGILDFTTDTSTVDWMDLSGDGCTIARMDPLIPFTNTGTCWDIAGQTMSIAVSGAVPSASAPLYDLSFTMLSPNTVSAPAPPSGASCDAPPPIDFAGTTVRCLGMNDE